jgi:hypothetical protein
MLKLNVGFTKKVGEANYGSRGASVNLDLELDSGLVGDPDRLKERIRQLFAMAKASVDEELAGQSPKGTATNGHEPNGNGTSPGNAHGPARQRDATRKATASQIRAIHAIVDRQRLDLTAILHERFGISDPAELTITEASAMIDGLKETTNGHGGKR